MRPQIETRSVQQLDLIPFDIAMREWKRLGPNKYDLQLVQKAELGDIEYNCPTCRFPPGVRGFVRLPWPVGHRFFGRAICCPDCWPTPFGHGSGILSETAQKIAVLWRQVEGK